MQPLRPPPAAVDALVAGSDRCALRWQCSPPRALRHRPPHNLCWQCPPPRPPLAASLPHYGTREIRSRLRQSTSRMNGLFAGGFWTRHALPGEIRTPRTFRAEIGRSGASECPNVARKQVYCPNVARKRSGIRKSPDNTTMFRSRPKTLRRARGRHAADERPVRSPWRSICNPNAISCITLGATRPVKPAEPTTRRSAKILLASRCRRQLPGSDFVQIHVRYLSDTSAFSLLAYLATNET